MDPTLTKTLDLTSGRSISIGGADERVDTMEDLHNLPTGYDLRLGYEATLGTLEFCMSAASGILYTIDHNKALTILTGQTTFLDGVTPLADRTFGIGPSSGETEFSYYYNGQKVIKTTFEYLQAPNIDKKHIYVFNSVGSLQLVSRVYDAIMVDVICGVVTYNTITGQKIVFANERHGLNMSSASHAYLHETAGTLWATGMDITGLADNTPTFTSITAGSMWDEDIHHENAEILAAPFAYREGIGGQWNLSVPDNQLGYKVGLLVQYNLDTAGTWSLEPISNRFIGVHFFATNDAEFPVIKIIGQKLYQTRQIAKAQIFEEVENIQVGSLPSPEFLHLGTCIIHIEDTGHIEPGQDNEVWIDMRHGYPVPRF